MALVRFIVIIAPLILPPPLLGKDGDPRAPRANAFRSANPPFPPITRHVLTPEMMRVNAQTDRQLHRAIGELRRRRMAQHQPAETK